jgi:hypothetical protein
MEQTMNKSLMLLVTLVLLAGLSAELYAGAGNRTGTSGASELLIPVGTRDIALGGATIATTKGVEALYWNPAGTAKMSGGVSLYFSHMEYIADIGVDYGAVAAAFEGIGTLSLSIKSLAIGDIFETTTQNPDGTGKTFSPQFFTVGVTYARQLSDRIAVGLTTNIVSERMADVSATGVAFNVGVMYDNVASLNGLSLGVVVKNIGPQMEFDGPGLYQEASSPDLSRGPTLYKIDGAAFELPSTLELGLGYRRDLDGMNSLQGSFAFQNNNYSDDEYKVGLEYSYQDVLFLRGGLNYSQGESEVEYIFGPTIGAGVHTALGSVDLVFDYAFRSVDIFDNNHVFSLKLGL